MSRDSRLRRGFKLSVTPPPTEPAHLLLPPALHQAEKPPCSLEPLESLQNLYPGRVTHVLAACVLVLTYSQWPAVGRPTPKCLPPSALRPDRPLPCPPVQGLLQLPARGFHLASEASLHFLWLLLFPLSTYLVGFQDPPRRRLGYMEVEIDTVPLLFNLVKERKKKEEFLARVAPSKPGDPTKDPGSLDRKRPARISLPNSNGLPTPPQVISAGRLQAS